METYGDSFIKFAISLVLYEAFPFEDEGFYSDLRKKICSNRNLFYIGRHINIGSYLMVFKLFMMFRYMKCIKFIKLLLLLSSL